MSNFFKLNSHLKTAKASSPLKEFFMHLSSIYSVILLTIQLLCICTGLVASSRDNSGPYFCLEHSPNTRLYQELHSLIPSDKRSCEHVWSPVCNSLCQDEVWWSEYHNYPDVDEDDDDLIEVYTCPCVDYNQYEWGEIAKWQSCKKRAIYNRYFAKTHIRFFWLLQRIFGLLFLKSKL